MGAQVLTAKTWNECSSTTTASTFCNRAKPMCSIAKRNGFGGFNRGQRTSRAASAEYKEAKDRAIVLDYLRLQYRVEPLELFWSPDHSIGPRWVARYESAVAVTPNGATSVARFRECVIRRGRVEEVD
jgi:hypothetical protein